MDKARKEQKEIKEITLEEIVAIRESLGLTQVEAGKLLGGGPSAYAKYEAGTVRPAAAAVNLLRMLKAHPEMLDELRGAEPSAISAMGRAPSPFEVSGKDIKNLSREDLPKLLQRLLTAEVEAHDLPADSIHVAENTDAPDGGEDGRVTWKDGPDRTRFLPSRRCQFQLKGGPVQPAQAGREILAKDGSVKDMIRGFLEDGGHYVMLCARSYTHKAIEKREESIRTALRGAGLDTARDCIHFRDAGQIAGWTNSHPAVAAWVKEKVEPGIPGPFRSWSHWAGRAEHSTPWAEDARLPEFQARLLAQATQPRGIARVVGPYGIGKSRLTLQALNHVEAGRPVSDLVLYADESEAGPHAIGKVIQSLADTGKRVIAVVDRCSPERCRILENMALREKSRLSLITIDSETSRTSSGKTELIEVEPPATAVIEAIINREAPGLPREDGERLVRFSAEVPAVAILVARAWHGSCPLAQAADDSLVDAVVLGRHPREPGLLRKTAALLAIFGKVNLESESGGELDMIAQFGRDLEADDLRAAMEDLATRKVIRRRGRLMIFPFSPIAARLAERQWREWPRSKWDEVLASSVSPELGLRAAQRLALLNDMDIARKVAAHVCREGGPLDGILESSSSVQINMLAPLAETNARAVTEFLERALDQLGNESEVRVSAEISPVLSRVAFCPDTFGDGARLLLRLASRNGRSTNGIARGRFAGLFPICEGCTAADGEARLEFLVEAIRNDQPEERPVLIDALIKGLQTHHFMRIVGDEIHGSRPALKPWLPDTRQEEREYLSGCMKLLIPFAKRDDDIGRVARKKLSWRLCDLLNYRIIDAVEAAVRRIREVTGGWPEAVENLNLFLQRDAREEDQNLIARVQKLLEQLQPQDLESRGRFLVTHMPQNYPADRELTFEERNRIQIEEIEKLAAAFAGQPEALMQFLPEISRGEQRMAFEFGREVACTADSPQDWLEPIAEAVTSVPEEERNSSLLHGYLSGIREDHPCAVSDFKKQAARSPKLAPELPLICQHCGIEPADINLTIDALKAGRLRPDHLLQWKYSKKFWAIPETAATPLFDRLLEGGEDAFSVGVNLLAMYACRDAVNFDELRPQVRRVAENAARHGEKSDRGILGSHFKQLMCKALKKGWQDPSARAVALTLAKALTRMGKWGQGGLIRSVLPKLLSDFTEIVWPVLGQAVVADPDRRGHFTRVLGSRLVITAEPPPILSLPEEALFEWCHEHPDCAPAFAASAVPVLATSQSDSSDQVLHPILSRLIDEFGEQGDMQKVITGRIHGYCFEGPGASSQCYELLFVLLKPLRDRHPKGPVRHWIRDMLRFLHKQAEAAQGMTEEREAQWEA